MLCYLVRASIKWHTHCDIVGSVLRKLTDTLKYANPNLFTKSVEPCCYQKLRMVIVIYSKLLVVFSWDGKNLRLVFYGYG